MKPKILFIADHWHTLDHERDSTLHLAQIAEQNYNAECFLTTPDNLFFNNQHIEVCLLGSIQQKKFSSLHQTLALSSFQSVHWRADPPVDLNTLRLWSLLDTTLDPKTKKKFFNPPRSLLTWNEKFAPLHFKNFFIDSFVSNNEKHFLDFLKLNANQKLIAKPVADAASRGVRFLSESTEQALQEILTIQNNSGPWVVLQKFETNLIEHGETRVFLVNGKIAAAIHKQPHPDRPIMSLDIEKEKQPKLTLANLSAIQKQRANLVGEACIQEGILLTTVDFIHDKILEINVTSPGLILWLDQQLDYKDSIAKKYWDVVFS